LRNCLQGQAKAQQRDSVYGFSIGRNSAIAAGPPARYFYFADHKIVTPYASFDALNNQQNQVERQLNMDESP
jgi:hypothetical protein